MKMTINQIYYSHKSSTCMNKDGKALSVYDSYQEAQNSALLSKNNNVVLIKLQNSL